MSRIQTAEEITRNYGERCPDFEPGCPCCQMWAMHDEIERLRASTPVASQIEGDVGGKETVTVPIEPPAALLRSMAIRYDHGLGVPGYYDQQIFGAENIGHARRMESTITTMRQLYEEVVGKGFYRPENSNAE